jgi:hypothetical protein
MRTPLRGPIGSAGRGKSRIAPSKHQSALEPKRDSHLDALPTVLAWIFQRGWCVRLRGSSARAQGPLSMGCLFRPIAAH